MEVANEDHVEGPAHLEQTSPPAQPPKAINIGDADKAYLDAWKTTVYTNLVMLRYILGKIFPESESPWKAYFDSLQGKIYCTKWTLATKKLKESPQQLFFDSLLQPDLTSAVPDYLWANGNGDCASFAIAINQALGLEASYVDYGPHRAAHKYSGDEGRLGKVIVIDSAARNAFQLGKGESKLYRDKEWKNHEGIVYWQGKISEPLANREEAIKCSLEQLWNTADLGLVLIRDIKNGVGSFNQTIQVSPYHKCLKLIYNSHNSEQPRQMRFLVFGNGTESNNKVVYQKLREIINPPYPQASKIVLHEINAIYQAATTSWGYPRMSLAFVPKGNPLQIWPKPRFGQA